MPIVSFEVSDEEMEIILRRMRTANEKNRSAHLRRVYFQGDTANEELMGGMRKQIEVLTDAIEQQQRLLKQLATVSSDGIELKVLSGLYLMLHPSVDPSTQAIVDQYLDVSAIEGFLQAKGRRK